METSELKHFEGHLFFLAAGDAAITSQWLHHRARRRVYCQKDNLTSKRTIIQNYFKVSPRQHKVWIWIPIEVEVHHAHVFGNLNLNTSMRACLETEKN